MVLGNLTQALQFRFVYEAITLYGPAFQRIQLWNWILPGLTVVSPDRTPQPPAYNAHRLEHMQDLGYSPFARHY